MAIFSAREHALGQMDSIIGLLHDTRGAIGDLQNVLSDLLTKAGGGGEDDPLTMIGADLSAVVNSLRRISDELGSTRVEGGCVNTRMQTLDIVRSGLEFQMVAKLTAITVASLPQRSPELESYASSFADITERLTKVSNDVEAQFARIVSTRGAAVADFGSAEADLKHAQRTLDAEIESTRTSASRTVEAEISRAAGHLRECARDELNKLVAAIQFADAFSQRAEHVVKALELAESALGTCGETYRRIALALSEDLLAGMRAASRDLQASFRRLGQEGEAANEVFEAGLGNGDLAAAIHGREMGLGRAAAQLARVAPMIEAIERRTGEIDRLAGEARASLGSLVAISRQIMVSAVNAGLIASRISSVGGPLTVLAAAAQSQAMSCSRQIGECAAGVNSLIATMDDLALDKVRRELDAATATARRLGEDARGAVGAQNALTGAGARIASILGALGRISGQVAGRLAGIEAAMASFDAGLAPVRAALSGPGRAPPDPAQFEILRKSYTMQSERDIHDRVLGVESRAQESVAAREDLDDIFF